MRFSLATNFDDKLIEAVAPLGTIDTVYGKLASDRIGGGRASYLLPNVSFKRLKQHIDLCHRHGIKFNYLLNSMCSGNVEITADHRSVEGIEHNIIG